MRKSTVPLIELKGDLADVLVGSKANGATLLGRDTKHAQLCGIPAILLVRNGEVKPDESILGVETEVDLGHFLAHLPV